MTEQQLIQRPEQAEPQRETLRKETKRKETFSDADVVSIADDRIDVSLTKDVFTAEATLIKNGDKEEKIMDFSEEEVRQEHSLTLERAIYDQFKASPWSVLKDVMEDADTRTSVSAWEQSPWDLVRHINLSLTDIQLPETIPVLEPTVQVSVPVQEHEPVLIEQPFTAEYAPSTVNPALDIYYSTASDEPLPYELPQHTTITYDNPAEALQNTDELLLDEDTEQDYSAPDNPDVTLPDAEPDMETYDTNAEAGEPTDETYSDDQPALEHQQYDSEATEHGIAEQVNYTATDDISGNAAEIMEQLFEETELTGSVETMTYQDTEDNNKMKESYWVEIDGLDMYRTEFFINGELADDSLDAYDLDAGDTLTFVEADLFDDNRDSDYDEDDTANTAEGCACGGDLYLDDLLEDTEDAVVNSYDVSGPDPVTNTYMPAGAEAAGYTDTMPLDAPRPAYN